MRGDIIRKPNSQISFLIDEWIHSERDRAILKDRFINGICYEPLAEKYDLSVRQIKTIVNKGENILHENSTPCSL